ncbi:MAG: aminotransferase class V-fold PLP-dependent enzyme [Candidatus Borkfalkiaceae bacterium]|nr:aminotransferase class V-fold PLP-dependent enzyme [Clostridia bacterium]MDY6222825.1 aminotransferase class V-fold PLP-dependent enzyme [Christensenellaceae bacterium]
MIYFDNAATGGRKPASVISAVAAALRVCANPGRSGHALSVTCAKNVLQTRELLAHMFDSPSIERVIFTKNCTEALNAFIFGVLEKGDHAVATPLEHNSVLRPLEKLKKSGVITYDICALKNGNVDEQSIKSLLKPNTKLVIVTSASNVTGAEPPITRIRKILPERVLLLCDGAQGAGHIPLSLTKQGLDGLCIAGHKGLFAMQGSGALLFSERVRLKPFMHGGTGSESFSLDMPDFYPDALEAGTVSYPAIISLAEGARYYLTHEREISAATLSLSTRFAEGLARLPDYAAYSSPNACGVFSFALKGVQSEEVAALLSERYSIAVRGGLHCAPLAHRALGTAENGLVRASFSHFNKPREVDRFLSALAKIAKIAKTAHR